MTRPDVVPSRERAGRVRTLVTTALDVVALVAVPFGAGLVAGVGVGIVVGGICAAIASWGITNAGAAQGGEA